MANPTLDEIALNIISAWTERRYHDRTQSRAALQSLIVDALKQRDSKVIARVTDALSKVLYER